MAEEKEKKQQAIEPTKTKLPIIVCAIILVIAIPLSVIFGTLYSIVWTIIGAVLLAVCIIRTIRGGYRTSSGKIVVSGILTVVIFLLGTMAYSSIPSGKKWQYPYQRRYMGACYDGLVEYFKPFLTLLPEELPENISDYSFRLDSKPTQLALFLNISYRCEGDTLQSVMDYYQENASVVFIPSQEDPEDIYARVREAAVEQPTEAERIAAIQAEIDAQQNTITLDDGMLTEETEAEEIVPEETQPELTNIELPPIPDDFQGNRDSAIVYVIESDYCFTTAGISFYTVIDPDTGWVEIIDHHTSRSN